MIMIRPLLLVSVSVMAMAAPAFAYDEAVTTTTVSKSYPDAYSKTVTQETTATNAPAPVIAPDTTVSRKVVVNRSDSLGNSEQTVNEQVATDSVVVAPQKPSTTTKRTETIQSNGYGDQRRVVTKQTVNGDGYMAREEYHEQRNY